MTVYVTGSTNASTGGRRYHTDRECPRLKGANKVRTKDLDPIPVQWTLCEVCAGEAHHGGASEGSYDLVKALEAADPDTPLGGGE